MSTLTNNYEHFEESEDDSDDDIVSNDDSASEESEDESSEVSNSEESEETGDENEDIHIKSGSTNEIVNDSDESGDKESCPVCLCQFIGQDLGTPENCTHTFCLECILEWSKNINTCPIDRNEFNNIHLRSTPGGKVLKKIKIEVKPKEPEGALQEDSTVCEVCHSGEREDRLLLCDACDLAYHCECLNPPLFHIPIEEWFCPPCARVLRTGAMAGCSTPRLRRVIPRTRASETVRTRVQNLRTTGNRPSTSASLNSPRSKAKTPQRRRRRTYGRSYKKVVQLARTKKNLMDGGKGKGCMKGSTIVVTYRRKCRRRRRKTKSRSKKTKVSATESAYIKSTQDRISKRLGLVKSTKGVFIPEVKSKGSKCSSLDNQRTVSLFGSKDELIDFSENEEENKPGPSKPSGSSKKSSSSSNKVRPISEASTSSLNLLDSIMASQTLLHSKPDNVIIRTDGSLTLKKSSNEPSSYSKKSKESSKAQVPSSSKSYTSTAKNGAIPKSKTISFKKGTSNQSSEFKSPFNILQKILTSDDNKNLLATKHETNNMNAESSSKFIETSDSPQPVKDKSISMSAAKKALWKSTFDNQGVDKPFQDPISETDRSQSISKNQNSISENCKSIKSNDKDESSNPLSPDYIRKKRLLFYSQNIVSASKYEANIHNHSEKLENVSHKKSSKKDIMEHQDRIENNDSTNSLPMNNSCSYLSENTIKALEVVLSTDDEDVETSQSLIQSVPNSYTEQLGEKVMSNIPLFNVLETTKSEEDLDFNESQSLIDLSNDFDKFQAPNSETNISKIRIKTEPSSDAVLDDINDQHENTNIPRISHLNQISTDNPKNADILQKSDLCNRSSIEEIKIKDEPQDYINVPKQDKSPSKSMKSFNQNLAAIKNEPLSSDEEDICSSRRFLKPMPDNVQSHLFESNYNNSENPSIEELPDTQPNVNLLQKETLSKNGDLDQQVSHSSKLNSQTYLSYVTSQSSEITNKSKAAPNAKENISVNCLSSTEPQKTTISSNEIGKEADNHSSSGSDVFLSSNSGEKDNPTALPVASKPYLQNTNDQDLKSSANQLISLMNNADFVRQLSQSQILTLVTNLKNHLSLQKNSTQSVIKNSDSSRVSENKKIASSKFQAIKTGPESNLPIAPTSLNDATNASCKNMVDIHEKQTVETNIKKLNISATPSPKTRVNLKLKPHTLQSTENESELDLPATQPVTSSQTISNPCCKNSSQKEQVKMINLANTCPESGNGSKSDQQLLQSTDDAIFLNLPATQCLSSDVRAQNNVGTNRLETNSKTTKENSNNKFDQPKTQPFLIDRDDSKQTYFKAHSTNGEFEFPETQPFVISENMCNKMNRNFKNTLNAINEPEQNRQSKAGDNKMVQPDSTKQKSMCNLNKLKNASLRKDHLYDNDTFDLPVTQPMNTVNYEQNLKENNDKNPEKQISVLGKENGISSVEKKSSSYGVNNFIPCSDINLTDLPSTQPVIQTKIDSLKIIKICNEIPENSSSNNLCRDLPPTQPVAFNAKTNNIKSNLTKNNLLSSSRDNNLSDVSEPEIGIFDKNKADMFSVETKQSLSHETEPGSIEEIKLAEQKKYNRKLFTLSYIDNESTVELPATQLAIVQKSIDTCSNIGTDQTNATLKFKNTASNSSDKKVFIDKINDSSLSKTSDVCLKICENSNVELNKSPINFQNTLRKEPTPCNELSHPLDDLPDNISNCKIDKRNYQKEIIKSDSSETEDDIFDDLPSTQLPFDRLPLMRTVENTEETEENIFDDLYPTQLAQSDEPSLKETVENKSEAYENMCDLPATQLAIENNESSLKQTIQNSEETEKSIFDLPPTQLAPTADESSIKQTFKRSKESVENGFGELPSTQLVLSGELFLKQVDQSSRDAEKKLLDDLPATQLAMENNDLSLNQSVIKNRIVQNIFDLPPTQLSLNIDELSMEQSVESNREIVENIFNDLPPTQQALSNELALKETAENSREAEKIMFDDLPATQVAIENNKSSLKHSVGKSTEIVKDISNLSSPRLAFNKDKLSLKQTARNRKETGGNMFDLPVTEKALNSGELSMKQTAESSIKTVENMLDDLPPTQIALNNERQSSKQIIVNKRVSRENIFDDLPPTQLALSDNKLLLNQTGKNRSDIEESMLDDLPPTQLAPINDKLSLGQTVENSREAEENMCDLPPTQLAFNNNRLLCNQTVKNNGETEESRFDDLPPTQLCIDNNELLLNTVVSSREAEGNMLDLPSTQLVHSNNGLLLKQTYAGNSEREENMFDDLPPTQLTLNNNELSLNTVENECKINKEIPESVKDSLHEAKNLELKRSPKKVGIHRNLPQVMVSKPSRLVPTPKPLNRKTFSFDVASKQDGSFQKERETHLDVINDNTAQMDTQLSGKYMDKLSKSRDSNKEKTSSSRSKKEFCDSDMHVATKNHECVKKKNENSKLKQNVSLTATEIKHTSSSVVSRDHKQVERSSKLKSKENFQNTNSLKPNQAICERQELDKTLKERNLKNSKDLRKVSKNRSLSSDVSLEKESKLVVSSKHTKNVKQVSPEVNENPYSKSKDWSDNESISGRSKKLPNEHKNKDKQECNKYYSSNKNNYNSQTTQQNKKNTSSNSNQRNKEIEKKTQLIESEKIKQRKFDSPDIKSNYIQNNEKCINKKQSSKETIPEKIKRRGSNSSITDNERTMNIVTSSGNKKNAENKLQQQEKQPKKKNQKLDNSLNTKQNGSTYRTNCHDKKDKHKQHVESFEINTEIPSNERKGLKCEKHKKRDEYKGNKRPSEELNNHNEYDIPPKKCMKKNELDKRVAKAKEEINKHLRKSKIDSVEHISKKEKSSKSHLDGNKQYDIDVNEKMESENIQKFIKKEKLEECIDYTEIVKRIKKETIDSSETNSLPPFCDSSMEPLLSPGQIKQEPLDETEFNFEEAFTHPVMRVLPSRFHEHSQKRKTAVVVKPILSVDNVSDCKKKDNFEATVVDKNVKMLKVPLTKRKNANDINCDIQKKQKLFENKSSQNNSSSKAIDEFLLKKFPKVTKTKNTPSKKVKSKTNVLDVLNKAADDIIKNSSYKVTHESLSINGRFEFEVVKDSPNSISSESKERKINKKQDLKEEIAAEVKKVLKPFYSVGVINKDDYKDIMRRAVPKIFMNCNNIIIPEKIKKLILNYVSMLKTS